MDQADGPALARTSRSKLPSSGGVWTRSGRALPMIMITARSAPARETARRIGPIHRAGSIPSVELGWALASLRAVKVAKGSVCGLPSSSIIRTIGRVAGPRRVKIAGITFAAVWAAARVVRSTTLMIAFDSALR